MEYRKVGKTGLKISEISLGAWLTYGGSVEKDQSKACITKAVELGINFIDIADVYARGNAERIVGEVLKEGNYDRQDLVISSKVFWPMSNGINDRGLNRKHIRESIENSLNRLQTDYLDIYFCHRFDRTTPLEETVRAMSELVEQGYVHYWGTSVWPAVQLERAVGIAKTLGLHPPLVEQPRYNMLDRFIELDIIDTCQRNGMGIVCWSPLAQGILTGKYNEEIPEGSRGATTQWLRRELNPENIVKVKGLQEVADSLEITMGQLALAWILRREEISCAITGATKPEHVESNVRASTTKLSKDTLQEIEETLNNEPQTHPLYKAPW
ncbi:MAG: aldo/keto reductase family protein [Candidatus Heimdallarchaeota archaeon]|nr:MAG: aldo/keto reductase family protein [Candidatus Heimdallarchaeota archaeon]